MKSLLFSISFIVLMTGCLNAQQFQPEDVIHSVGQTQLKYKHLMAYVDIEMAGEDPALLNNQSYLQELTEDCLEEFMEDPVTIVSELDEHYQAMLAGAGYLTNSGNKNSYVDAQQTNTNYTSDVMTQNGGSQMKQILSGSALYTTATQHHNGITIQSTQILHLCPNGTAHIYQRSGGGGGEITALDHTEYQGAISWNIIEQNGMAYFQYTLEGATQYLPIQVVDQKLVIQGLGAFSVEPGGAQCR